MIVLQEAIVIVLIGLAVYYACDYSAHHRSYEVFQTDISKHETPLCETTYKPVNKQYFAGDWNEAFLDSPDSIRGECFFSEGYDDARETFRLLAKIAEADEIFDLTEVAPGLSTSVAVFRGAHDKFLIHVSGTHGVEAYAGSAVQLGILQHLQAMKQSGNATKLLPTIVLVHALNPFGFKNNRRVNENNVDLNRNFLSAEEWTMVRERDPNYSGYVDLQDVLNPRSRPFRSLALNEIYSLWNTVYAAVHIGVSQLKRAMVSGNYHFDQGYGFGGFETAQSTRNLKDLLLSRLRVSELAKAVVLLDVHTGLGPTGVDTLFYSQSQKFGIDDIERIFPTETDPRNPDMIFGALKTGSLGNKQVDALANGSTGHKGMHGRAKAEAAEVSAGYELTIGTTESFCVRDLAPHLDHDRRVCVAQEFGTVPVMVVGKYAIDENYAHFHGTSAEKKYYSTKLVDCFYVQTNDWRRKIVYRGMKLFLQAQDYIGSL